MLTNLVQSSEALIGFGLSTILLYDRIKGAIRMDEASPAENERSNWRRELGSIFGNKWLTAAVAVELVGLVAAFGSMPVWGLPIAWTLSLTGILSAGGVLIVTVYFVLQYNRRPLNNIQIDEVRNMLALHIERQEAQNSFAPKGELSQFVQS